MTDQRMNRTVRGLGPVLAAVLVVVSSVATAAAPDPQQAVVELQTQWAKIKYETPEGEQAKAYEPLVAKAEAYVAQHPDSAEVLIWAGIVRSTYAGTLRGFASLGALSQVKAARTLFERAIEIDPKALSGSAYTSLGSLYYQVPGWPVGFGNADKARDLLLEGLAISPDGIDANYFYGDFLIEQGEYDEAEKALQRALRAPSRLGRELADQGRRDEIHTALARIREKRGH